MQSLGQLTGTVKHYDWGGTVFIPSLLRVLNKESAPFAEYWMGIHPQADCQVIFPGGGQQSLRESLAEDQAARLGAYVFQRFGNMPYLLKALDVRDMLSIQVHPSKAAAERDFRAENEAGVPLSSPQRNYKDDNHKPELMVAIGEFWLLHGFKPEAELSATLGNEPALSFLLPVFESQGYAGLYRAVMEMPQEEVNSRLQPLLDRMLPLYKEGKLSKETADYWAAKASITFSQPGKTDRGIFSVYLFNLVKLNRGEAIFQDAGVPHAYLEGQNVEIMASSDNVLRGGLTTKHIDVQELLKHTVCGPTHPKVLKGEKEGAELIYRTPAPDFELSVFALEKGQKAGFNPGTAEILLLIEGKAVIESGGEAIVLEKGQPSAIVYPGAAVSVNAVENSLVYRAGVPQRLE